MSTEFYSDAEQAAAIIRESFEGFYQTFTQLTDGAKIRFQNKQWNEQRAAVRQRILLQEEVIEKTAHLLSGFHESDKGWWKRVAMAYDVATKYNPLAQSFFDAVGRIHFKGDLVSTLFHFGQVNPEYSNDRLLRVDYQLSSTDWVTNLLHEIGFEIPTINLIGPAQKIDELLNHHVHLSKEASLYFYPNLFYRNKHAYLMGYALNGDSQLPLLMAFTNGDDGVVLDALLIKETDIKNVFAFSRSYFLVTTNDANALIKFLMKVMPSKPEAQLYMNLGYQEHGKEMVVGLLHRHLQLNRSQFLVAPGIPGMVMMVFTLPDYDLVFKIIRDHFKPPKSVTREEVIEKYTFIALHDRVGRLADAQRFEYLGLPLAYFTSDLLAYLLSECSQSVSVRNGIVCFRDIYAERKMIPLNLYLEQANAHQAEEAVIDFGNAIREMALSNIFPGDLLIKNFGVTNEDRVVFYDYDEIVPLVDCTFKQIPKARNEDDELSAEPWYAVNENDIFPEEMIRFLLPEGHLRIIFSKYHETLYTASFWNQLKEFHQQGEIVDIQPYETNLL